LPWRGPEEPGEFPTLGFVWIDWIESTLRFTDGPKAGEPVQLYDEQAMHIIHRGRLRPDAIEDDGNEAFVRSGSMLVRGQKWGKDPLLAMVDLVHAFGPCDFAGWDANGEPVGREHPSPWVFVAALNDRQTDNTWLPLKAMVENSELVDLPGVEVNLDMIRLPCGNPIEPLTTTAFGRLGGRFTAGSITENGLMTDTVASGMAGSGKRSPLGFARTLIRSVTRMNGMWIAATNTWDPTEKSHAQIIHDSKPKRVYIDAKISRRRVDLDDDEGLRDELLYLYGDSAKENGGHVSVKSLVEDCRDTQLHGENEIRRFFLSEIVAGERDAVDKAVWDAASRKGQLEKGEMIALGFDGSRARDATALVACRISDGRLFPLGMWEPRKYNGKVPRAIVHANVKAAFAAYDVIYLFGDPYLWQDALDTWAGLFPKKVVEFPTNVEVRMDKAIERFRTALRNGDLTHDGDTALTEHALNAGLVKGKRKAKREDEETGQEEEHYLKVVKKRAGLIDYFIAAILAYAARGQAIEDGALSKNTAPPPQPVRAGKATPAADSIDGVNF
jgi:hypothetical protein